MSFYVLFSGIDRTDSPKCIFRKECIFNAFRLSTSFKARCFSMAVLGHVRLFSLLEHDGPQTRNEQATREVFGLKGKTELKKIVGMKT